MNLDVYHASGWINECTNPAPNCKCNTLQAIIPKSTCPDVIHRCRLFLHVFSSYRFLGLNVGTLGTAPTNKLHAGRHYSNPIWGSEETSQDFSPGLAQNGAPLDA